MGRNWAYTRFGAVVAHSAFGPRFSGGAYSDEGNVAAMRTTDLDDDGTISYENMPLARLDEARFAAHFLQPGDLVVTRSGTCGIAAVFKGFSTPVIPGAFLIRFRLGSRGDPVFFRYFFNSPDGRKLVSSVARGAVQQNLTIPSLENLAVPLPPLDCQRSIARVLSAYDDLVENNRRRMLLLEESARLLYREWFVHLRFPGHERTRVADGVPKGWQRRALKTLAHVNREALDGAFDGEIEYVDISSVSPGRIDGTTVFHIRDAPSRARRLVRHGDIIWSCVRPGRRSHAMIWRPQPNLVVSTGFAVISSVEVPASFSLPCGHYGRVRRLSRTECEGRGVSGGSCGRL